MLNLCVIAAAVLRPVLSEVPTDAKRLSDDIDFALMEDPFSHFFQIPTEDSMFDPQLLFSADENIPSHKRVVYSQEHLQLVENTVKEHWRRSLPNQFEIYMQKFIQHPPDIEPMKRNTFLNRATDLRLKLGLTTRTYGRKSSLDKEVVKVMEEIFAASPRITTSLALEELARRAEFQEIPSYAKIRGWLKHRRKKR